MYTISNGIKAVEYAIRGYLIKDEAGKYLMNEVNRLPIYLEGPPGIGKTRIVRQIADRLNIGYVSFSITHHSRNTVLGLPVIESGPQNEKYTEYTMSEIIAKVKAAYENGQKEGILLLDEFNCMAETLMPIMLAFLQTKNIGAHTLPEGWVIVLCGNPGRYNKSARSFDSAILDRVRKLELTFDNNDFLAYAAERNFEQAVIEYLRLNPQAAYVTAQEGKPDEIATPRSWENLDCAIKMYVKLGASIDADMVMQFIKSEKCARSFARFYENFAGRSLTAQDHENILNGVGLEKYVERFKAQGQRERMNIVDSLCAMLEGGTTGKTMSPRKLAVGVESILALTMGAEDTSMSSRVFGRVNNNQTLLSAVSKGKCPRYLELCRNSCYYTH